MSLVPSRGPRVVPRSEHNISRGSISPEALKVLYRLKQCGHLAYLAGGSVRDLLLHRKPKDFDVATDATPNEMRRLFRNCRLIGRRFRLAHVYFDTGIIEVATFRASASDATWHTAEPAGTYADGKMLPQRQEKASPEGDSQPPGSRHSHPLDGHRKALQREDGLILRDNVFGTPEDDAIRRDFTINALFYNIDGFSVIDYVGGLDDLAAGLIRPIGDPRVRYAEDPVRMIRAIRFASSLGFRMEDNAYEALIELRSSIEKSSNARLYEEVLKLFLCGAAEKAYDHLTRTGLFAVMFPRVGSWLDATGGTDGRRHMSLACRCIDELVRSGRTVKPSLLLTLMFGRYIESRAASLAAGLQSVEAVQSAVSNYISETAPRVLVPKRVGFEMAHLLSAKLLFSEIRGRRAVGFTRRAYFGDALEYFKFATDRTAGTRELVKWWQDTAKMAAENTGRSCRGS